MTIGKDRQGPSESAFLHTIQLWYGAICAQSRNISGKDWLVTTVCQEDTAAIHLSAVLRSAFDDVTASSDDGSFWSAKIYRVGSSGVSSRNV